uniref:SOGA coiled-coil domain-containing protein n=1 Tax=Photinus pyralis TaxID=7054 RepID=A0A1Y1KT21_PHOPY
MHHLYPLAKGDPLCPLGFHPQVRWPTRCKRCFRDYKEHGGKRKEEELSLKRNDSTSSSPNLNSWSIRSDEHRRSWSSNSNLTEDQTSKIAVRDVGPASWTSTPDLAHLEDSTQANIPTVSFTLPKRKSLEISSNTRSLSDSFSTREKSPAFNKSEHSSTRAKKIQAIKDASQEMSKRIQIKELKATVDESTNHDVKSKPKQEQFKSFHEGTESEDDTVSIAGTETTDTTLVGNPHEHEMQEQIDSLRQELDAMKTKCERLDREKSDLLLRRLASMETVTSKTTATEVLKLQQKCNELQSQIEDSRDEKKFLALRVKELEEDVDSRPTAQAAQKHADELRSKLLAAETLCEELMDENEDMKKELRDLEEEIEELQDNFREDQANEYTSLKKELEQTTKNCRILSFKLRKTERKTEQLEVEKGETEKKLREVSNGNNGMEKIKHLEQGLKVATETSLRLQKELDETTAKLRAIEETSSSKKASAIGNIPKLSSDAKVSRESLTRGGSQDDPAQILRDLHDSLEREADLREQLKFAEEEAQNLRKKTSRIEDDNESLVLQLKKMATKAKNRKGSPNRLTPEPIIEKDEGISEDDPTELKLLLELNDQEVSVLRKKVEELEAEKDTHKKKIKDLQDKLTTKTSKKSLLTSVKGQESQDKKLKVLEDETVNLKKQLAEKDKETERLSAELNLTQKRTKGMQKSKSLDIADPQSLDVKRQLQSIEQEAVVLRTKIQTLESENEKLAADNKRLQLLRNTKTSKSEKAGEKYIDRIAELEVELEYANKKVKELENSNGKHKSNDKEGENNRQKPLVLAKQFKDRIPKKPSEFTSKIQLKNMVKDLESEIGDILTALANAEGSKGKLEAELQELKSRSNNIDLTKNLEETKKSLIVAEKELQNVTSKYSQDRSKYDDLNNTLVKTKENLSSQLEEKKTDSE